MAKYRKKPVVIEAFQMTKARRWDNSEWPNWLNVAWQEDDDKPGSLQIDPMCEEGEKLEIATLEGNHRVSWNDWIIRGVQGEIYPCKPDIFEATYEPDTTEVEMDRENNAFEFAENRAYDQGFQDGYKEAMHKYRE